LTKLSGNLPDAEGFGLSPEAFTGAPESVSRNAVRSIGITPQAAANNLLRQESINEATVQQERAIDETARAFLSIAWSLAGIPGRKSLIWASGSFPFYVDQSSPEPENPALSRLYRRTMEALTDAQVSVYPVDVRGLTTNMQPVGGVQGAVNRSMFLKSTLHNLMDFAEMTGGRAFYNSNDLAAGFREGVEDSSSYCVLGYYLSAQDVKPGWRKLHVLVQHSEWEVRSRSGFFAGYATFNPGPIQKADETFAMISPFDSTGVPLLLRWNLPTDKNSHERNVKFAVIVPAASVIEESDVNRFDIDFLWQATKGDALVTKDAHSVKGALNAENLAKIKREGVFYKNALKLKPGSYQVRVVVRDNLSGRIGSLTAPLAVN
jgi:hypothetical protein